MSEGCVCDGGFEGEVDAGDFLFEEVVAHPEHLQDGLAVCGGDPGDFGGQVLEVTGAGPKLSDGGDLPEGVEAQVFGEGEGCGLEDPGVAGVEVGVGEVVPFADLVPFGQGLAGAVGAEEEGASLVGADDFGAGGVDAADVVQVRGRVV